MRELKFIHSLHQKFHSFLEGLSAEELGSLEKGESTMVFSLEYHCGRGLEIGV